MVECLLCQTVFDMTHEYTFDFDNPVTQESYFRTRIPNKQYLTNSKCDGFRKSIMIECDFDDILMYDYLMLKDGINKFFYFITSKQEKTKTVTELFLKLDVFQTYMFNYKIGKSFVDRCHVNRWLEDGTPTSNNVDENLEYGSTIIKKKEDIYTFPLNYILVSTTPIGQMQNNTQSISSSTGGNPSNFEVSYKYIRYLKGVEGLETKPRDTGDGEITFGYGITKSNDGKYFNMMNPPPVSDKLATQVLIQNIKELYAKPVAEFFIKNGIDLGHMPVNHFDAFVDLAYNCGVPTFKSSTIAKIYIENGVTNDLVNQWKNFKIMQGTTFEQGLKYRRNTELNILQNNKYDCKEIQVYGGSPIKGDGYLPNNDIQSIQDKIVNSAKELISKPYVWGGTFPKDGGTDCSGLCQYAYAQNGISIPRVTYTQVKTGKKVEVKDVKKGDLIFSRFNGTTDTPEHVFLYSGFNNGKHFCIEAKKTGTLISEHEFTFTQEMEVRRIL